jgi:hypothetical protein
MEDNLRPAGNAHTTGTNLKGEPVDIRSRWTTTYIRQDGKWKIRMLTAMPVPAPQAK